jgi:hypothetical protein
MSEEGAVVEAIAEAIAKADWQHRTEVQWPGSGRVLDYVTSDDAKRYRAMARAALGMAA